jgi:hypothetical protein
MMIHAAPIEVVCFVVSLIGWVVKLFLTAMARENYIYHRKAKAVHVYMSESIYNHMKLMLGVFTVALAASINGVLHQPPPPPIEETQSLLNICFWITMMCLLTIHALFVVRWWRRLGMGEWNGEAVATATETSSGLKLPLLIKTEISPPMSIKTEVKDPER